MLWRKLQLRGARHDPEPQKKQSLLASKPRFEFSTFLSDLLPKMSKKPNRQSAIGTRSVQPLACIPYPTSYPSFIMPRQAARCPPLFAQTEVKREREREHDGVRLDLAASVTSSSLGNSTCFAVAAFVETLSTPRG